MDAEVTKELIGKTVNDLLKTRPLNKITIGEITDQAHVSRQTFYYHFKDVFSVYRFCIESKLPVPSKDSSPSLIGMMFEWMQAFEKLRTFTIEINSSKYQRQLIDYLDAVNRKTVMLFLKKNTDFTTNDEATMAMTVEFLTFAINGTMIQWVADGMKRSAVDICNAIVALVEAGLNGVAYIAMTKNWVPPKENGGIFNGRRRY